MIKLKKILLDLLSERDVEQIKLDDLSEDQWQAIWDMSEGHRVTPLLYWQLRHRRLTVPTAWLDKFKASYQASALRSLTIQAELLNLHRIFDSLDIHYIVLKGSYLAYNIYPHPVLRPMRDVDLLLDSQNLLNAYEKLREIGFIPYKTIFGNLESPKAILAQGKHLPPLISPNNVKIELHDKIFHPEDWFGNDLTTNKNFWGRCRNIDMFNKNFYVMSDSDLLLHLIVHASYDHQFNNGPLVFTDISHLLKQNAIDWDLFWKNAKKGRVEIGCILVLRMVKYFFPSVNIQLLDDSGLEEKVIIRFSLLSLQDYFAIRDQAALGNLFSKRGIHRYSLFLRKLFPEKNMIAAIYNVDTSIRIYPYYVLNWGRLISRIPYLLQAEKFNKEHKIATELTALKQLLKQND